MAYGMNNAKLDTMALDGQITERMRDYAKSKNYHWTTVVNILEGAKKGRDTQAQIREVERALKAAGPEFQIDTPENVYNDISAQIGLADQEMFDRTFRRNPRKNAPFDAAETWNKIENESIDNESKVQAEQELVVWAKYAIDRKLQRAFHSQKGPPFVLKITNENDDVNDFIKISHMFSDLYGGKPFGTMTKKLNEFYNGVFELSGNARELVLTFTPNSKYGPANNPSGVRWIE